MSIMEEFLNDLPDEPVVRIGSVNQDESQDWRAQSPKPAPKPGQQDLDLCQWQVTPNGIFRPAAKTIKVLDPAAYSTGSDDLGPYLRTQPLLSDEIVDLPDAANHRVLSNIKKFWAAAVRYRTHGLLFKRGILLYGPPGSGKTVTIHLLTLDLISNGGIVLFCGAPRLMLALLAALRRVEPARPLIVVLEDIDEIIQHHGEHEVLSMLDGENQTDNVVFIATTNYPERLGGRIVNRPSRFDERIYVGMPSVESRRAYFRKISAHYAGADGIDVEKWAVETAGLSIAHLRELVAAVMCLDQEYADVLGRLKAMNKRPKDIDGFGRQDVGYLNGAVA